MGQLLDPYAMLGFRFTPEALALLNQPYPKDVMSDQDIPVIGPVTVTFRPEHAAELGMVLQHILYNIPDNLRPDQAARAHTLGEAALLLSDAFVQAMHDAGISDEMIARASGRILMSAPEANAAQLEFDDPTEPATRAALDDEMAGAHPLDQPAEPTNPSAEVVDFPTPGGPPDAA